MRKTPGVTTPPGHAASGVGTTTAARSCRNDGHSPAEPVLTDLPRGTFARAVVNCRRCGSYITSFEGAFADVARAASSSMHGLRFVPV